MKVKVIKGFLDRYTGLKRKPGDVFEVTSARLREIRRNGDYVELLKPEPKVEKAEKEK